MHRGRPQGVLVDRQQDTSGDYGYDLAHEATRRDVTSADGTQERRRPVDGQPGAGEDLGYDEAHDFR